MTRAARRAPARARSPRLGRTRCRPCTGRGTGGRSETPWLSSQRRFSVLMSSPYPSRRYGRNATCLAMTLTSDRGSSVVCSSRNSSAPAARSLCQRRHHVGGRVVAGHRQDVPPAAHHERHDVPVPGGPEVRPEPRRAVGGLEEDRVVSLKQIGVPGDRAAVPVVIGADALGGSVEDGEVDAVDRPRGAGTAGSRMVPAGPPGGRGESGASSSAVSDPALRGASRRRPAGARRSAPDRARGGPRPRASRPSSASRARSPSSDATASASESAVGLDEHAAAVAVDQLGDPGAVRHDQRYPGEHRLGRRHAEALV